jgi:hypothetical protein
LQIFFTRFNYFSMCCTKGYRFILEVVCYFLILGNRACEHKNVIIHHVCSKPVFILQQCVYHQYLYNQCYIFMGNFHQIYYFWAVLNKQLMRTFWTTIHFSMVRYFALSALAQQCEIPTEINWLILTLSTINLIVLW